MPREPDRLSLDRASRLQGLLAAMAQIGALVG
jgi:hypothetical protein